LEHRLYLKMCSRYNVKPSKRITVDRPWKPKRGPPIVDADLLKKDPAQNGKLTIQKHPDIAIYEDRLKCINLFEQNPELTTKDIAEEIGRSARFVSKWWKKHPASVPKPKYLDNYDHEGWRDVFLARKFVEDDTLYSKCLQTFQWEQAKVVRTDRKTGKKEATNRNARRQVAEYIRGVIPELDKVLDRAIEQFNIPARHHIILNWYCDGRAWTGAHRHDCWTALLSLGCDRVLTIDNTNVVLEDGDLVVFGTQKHGVPMMINCKGGRISIPIFYSPGTQDEAWSYETTFETE